MNKMLETPFSGAYDVIYTSPQYEKNKKRVELAGKISECKSKMDALADEIRSLNSRVEGMIEESKVQLSEYLISKKSSMMIYEKLYKEMSQKYRESLFLGLYDIPFSFSVGASILSEDAHICKEYDSNERAQTLQQMHLICEEDIKSGVLTRKRGSFLCNNGKNSVRNGLFVQYNEAAPDGITCKKCLKEMERFKISQNEDLQKWY